MLRTVGGQSPFAILGVVRNAPAAEVRKVWMSEARRWHPDKRHHDTPKEHGEARQRFEDVHAAYEAITDYYREHGEPQPHDKATEIKTAREAGNSAFKAAKEAGMSDSKAAEAAAADSSERAAADAAFYHEWRVKLEAEVKKAEEELDHAKQVAQEVEEYHNELQKQLRLEEHSEEDLQALLLAAKKTYVALTNCRMRVQILQNGLKRLRQKQESLRFVMGLRSEPAPTEVMAQEADGCSEPDVPRSSSASTADTEPAGGLRMAGSVLNPAGAEEEAEGCSEFWQHLRAAVGWFCGCCR